MGREAISPGAKIPPSNCPYDRTDARQLRRLADIMQLLDAERVGHRIWIVQLLERGRRIPHAKMREQEEYARRWLQIYYASLIAEREITERGQEAMRFQPPGVSRPK